MAEKASHPQGMSALARLLNDKQADGMSFREMERIALQHGFRLTSSSFEQIAKDQRARRLSDKAIRALAVVLGIAPHHVAQLDDQRWGLTQSQPGVTTGVEAAIMADSTLNRRTRRALLGMYRELRDEGEG